MNYNGNINYNQQVPMASTVPVQGQQPYPQPYMQPAPYPTQPFPQPSYGPDQASFSPVMPPTTPTPAVGVSLIDKAKAYFQDVYNTEENLRNYKVFQQITDSDPRTLKPGSSDKGRVEQLQRNLNIAGVKANINGIYGYATGEAVKEFKTKYGISDGFLDDDGKPAVTDIATPQMQSVLNSVVSKQLNPNMPGPGNPMPVTQQDMLWAQELMQKVQQFGYKPSQVEYNRYQDIQQRMQYNGGAPGMPQMPPTAPQQPVYPQPPVQYPQQPSYPQQPTYPQQPAYPQQPTYPQQPYNPTPNPPVDIVPGSGPVSQQELDWAVNMQERILGGYQPSPQEMANYDSIQKRYAAQGQQGPAPAGQLQPVTQAELDWAVNMQERIKGGYYPTQQEATRYTDIFNRYQSQPVQQPSAPTQVQPTQPTPTAPSTPTYQPVNSAPVVIDNTVSPEEYQWALDLLYRIDSQGYRPTQHEITRYTDVYNRYQAMQAAQAQQPPVTAEPTSPTSPGGPVTQAELQWALEMEQKVNGGYQPTQQEIAKYQDIAQRMQTHGQADAPAGQTQPTSTPQPTQPVNPMGATQDEVQWARWLKGKMAEGYQASAEEIAKYNQIQFKMATYGVQQAGSTVPTSGTGPVTQSELDWAMQLQQKVQMQGYQPTQQEVAQYTDIYSRYQQQLAGQQAPQQSAPQQQPVQPPQQPQQTPTYAPVTPPVAPSGVQPPSQQEIQWAMQLQQAVQQGYKASEQEIAQYTDIYNRMNASAGQPVPPQQPQMPSTQQAPQNPYGTPPGQVAINVNGVDPELQWALDLLNRYRGGYQPSQSELVLYEQIIARKAVPNATP